MSHSFHGLMMNSINWPASSVWVFIAQLVEPCSVNAEATGSNPVEAPKTFFFSGYFAIAKIAIQLRWSHIHFPRLTPPLALLTDRAVLVWRTCQSLSKPPAWRVVFATVESAAVSSAGTTGQSGSAGLARVTRPFASAHSPCCSGSRTCSEEMRFAPGDSAKEGISRMSIAYQ